MKDTYLRAIEPLLRNCHELAIDAREAAAEGRDAVLQHRLGALAKLIADELTTLRANINAKARRPSDLSPGASAKGEALAKDGRAG
jgi:hypothetical protein